MVCVAGADVPGARALDTVTFRVGLADGLLVFRYTIPEVTPEFQVTWICGSGVPLLLPEITPFDTDQVMEVVWLQLPEMV
jgi:hypothetical protein